MLTVLYQVATLAQSLYASDLIPYYLLRRMATTAQAAPASPLGHVRHNSCCNGKYPTAVCCDSSVLDLAACACALPCQHSAYCRQHRVL